MQLLYLVGQSKSKLKFLLDFIDVIKILKVVDCQFCTLIYSGNLVLVILDSKNLLTEFQYFFMNLQAAT